MLERETSLGSRLMPSNAESVVERVNDRSGLRNAFFSSVKSRFNDFCLGRFGCGNAVFGRDTTLLLLISLSSGGRAGECVPGPPNL